MPLIMMGQGRISESPVVLLFCMLWRAQCAQKGNAIGKTLYGEKTMHTIRMASHRVLYETNETRKCLTSQHESNTSFWFYGAQEQSFFFFSFFFFASFICLRLQQRTDKVL